MHVLVNDTSIFDGVVLAAPVSFSSAPLTLAAGDTIDLAVGVGPNGNYYNDLTGVDATVTMLEPGLSGWTIYLDDNRNGRRDVGERFTQTDENGNYAFTGLPPDEYVVAEEPKPGWTQTAPDSRTYAINLAEGQIVTGKDFGNTAVTGSNLPPEFAQDPVPPGTANVDQLLRYPAIAIDPNNDPLTFDLPLAPDGMTVHPELGVVVWLPTREQVGTHQVVLRVQDGQGGIDLQSFSITVVPPNSPPVITSTPPSPAVVDLPYVYQVRAQDADAADTVAFRLQDPLAGMAIDEWTGRFTWTPTTEQIGSRAVTIIASDRHPDGETSQTFTLEVVATAPNDPPVITSTPRERARVGQPYMYLVQAADPNGDELTFYLDTKPDGMTIDAKTGSVSWQVPPEHLDQVRDVTVRVSDGRGGEVTQAFQITVGTRDSNLAPQVVSNTPLTAVVGRTYQYQLAAYDPEGDPVVWRLDSAPAGMSIDALRGTVRWTPAADQTGPQAVVVRVQDVFGASSTQSCTIQVRAVNLPPTISSSPIVQANPGELYVYAPRATDPDGDPLQFRLSVKPDGMTIDQNTGLVRWTPTAAQNGPHTVRIVVEDGQGGIDAQAYTLNVGQQVTNRSPIVTSTPVYYATLERLYQYPAAARDPEAQTVTWSLASKPVGMEIDQGSGVITWTPEPNQGGEHTVTVVATDPAGAAGKQTFLVTARPNQQPQIVAPPDQSIAAGVAYRYDVRATDPDGDSVRFALDAGPDGLTMDERGRIAWTPPAPPPGETSYTATIRFTARDDYGGAVGDEFLLTVVADTELPQIRLSASTNLVNVGDEVTFYLEATDKVAVANVELTVGGQPVALDTVWNGQLVGRVETRATVQMTQPGLIDAVATALDAAGNSATNATWQVRVIDPNDTAYPEVAFTAIVQGDTRIEGESLYNVYAAPTITYLADVYGTVQADNLEFWRLEYARADLIDLNNFADPDPDWIEMARGTTNVSETKLARFDPTLLANDSYVFRLYAMNTNGLIDTKGLLFAVSGEAKLGNFHLDFTDLQLPLAGIPITITRSYDTLNARDEGDFGYGWSLGIQDGKIREIVPAGGEFVPGQTRVYVTNPEGRRVGFTYHEVPLYGGFWGDVVYRPEFRPDPGVYDRLSIDQATITRGGVSGLFGVAVQRLGGVLMNPDAYTLTTKDGLQYRFDQSAGLQKITAPTGTTVTITETAITHSTAGSIQLVRDPRGRITEILGPPPGDGSGPATVRYRYDAAGDLVGFTNQAGETTTYEYLPDSRYMHFLDKIYDSRDVKIFDAEFDDDGRLVGSTDALGNSVQQNFDPDNFTGTIQDANGNVTELLYDERGNVLKKSEPNSADPAHPFVTQYEYGDPNHPDKETKVTDRNGVVETRAYDAAGNMTQVTRAAGTPQATTVAYGYNARGDVTQIQQNGQPPTAFAYDSTGKLQQIINAVGASASATSDSLGRQTSFTDFNGNKTEYDYTDGCPCGSPKEITYADGSYELFAYNAYGQVTQHDVFERDGTLVETSSTAYDQLGRVVEETQGSGAAKTVVQKHYDGNLLDWEIIVNPASPNETPATPIADRQSRITDYTYDAAGRMIRQTDAEGGVVEFRYDANGNRVLLQDPVGNITTWLYDSGNRMVEERDPFYWVDYVTANPAQFAGKTGDAFLTEIVSANTGPSGASAAANVGAEHVRVYAYDGEGNQTKIIDRNGRRREFTYDPLGRLTEERWYDLAGALVRTIDSTYDAVGNLKTITDPDSTYTYTYDTLNRVQTIDNAGTPDMPHVILTYQYDAMGNVTSTSDNLGVSVVSTYDDRNRLASRWWEGDSVDAARVDFLYTATGRESRINRYSDLAGTTRVAYTDRTYDTAGRSQMISHQRAVDDVIARYDYEYDFAGLLQHEDRRGESYPNNDWHADYTYDRTGQLLGADYSGADVIPEQVDEYYRYDANGNRVESYRHGTDYRTGPANQLLTDGTYNYAYDGEGNMVRKTEIATGQVTTFEYDHRNLMCHATIWSSDPASGGVILHKEQYRYDALNRRTSIIVDSDGAGARQTHTNSLIDQGLARGTLDSSLPFDGAWRYFPCHQSVSAS